MKTTVIAFILGMIVVLGMLVAYEVNKRSIASPEGPYNEIIDKDDESIIPDQVTLTFVSGTEYVPNDPNGKTIVALRDHKNDFINTSCYETILYPNRSTFVDFTLMTVDEFFGTYFLDFDTGPVQGIYDQEIFCEVKGENISNGKAYHVNNITQEIKLAEINIKQSVDTVMDALNCSLDPNVTICQQLQNLTSIIISSTNDTNQLINTSEEILIQINNSVNNQETLFFEIEAPNCHILTVWNFTAKVTDDRGHSLPFLTCQLESDRFGLETVSYNENISKYQTTHNCTAPAGLVQWNFTCAKQYT